MRLGFGLGAVCALVSIVPLFASACGGGDDGGGGGPEGPPGEILEFDAAAVHNKGANGGSGGKIAACVGYPKPCGSRSVFQCGSGCEPVPECMGTATMCLLLSSPFTCANQDGCYWSTSSCKGTSSDCWQMYDPTSCATQIGCYWSTSCGGYPTPCEALTLVTCASQPGCELVYN